MSSFIKEGVVVDDYEILSCCFSTFQKCPMRLVHKLLIPFTHFHYSLFQILRKEMAALVGDDDVYE